MQQIILASSSPRRKALLRQLGLTFTSVAPDIDEKLNPRLKPRSNAEQLSLLKAQSIAAIYPQALIIAADTFIVFAGEIIGKPKDGTDAKRTLTKLSGKPHQVITGFTVLDAEKNKAITESVETTVYFKKLTRQEIGNYIASEEGADAAGSYKMQEKGAVFIEKIDGDYFNVVGLPLNALYEALKKFDVEIM